MWTALWVVVDGVCDVVWVTWCVNGVMVGGGQCLRRRLGDVARVQRCGGWWTVPVTLFG